MEEQDKEQENQSPVQNQVVMTPQETITQQIVTPGVSSAIGQVQAAQEQQASVLRDFSSELRALAPLQRDAYAKSEEELIQIEADRQARQQQIDLDSNMLRDEIKQEEIKLAEMKPQQFWKKADTGDKIKMALAVMLGAIGQGLSGSRVNPAIQMMNKVIADDLQAQKDEITKRADYIKSKKSTLLEKARVSDRANLEFKLRKQATLDRVNQELEGLKAQTTNVRMLAAIEEKQAEIGQAKAAMNLAIEKEIAGQTKKVITRENVLAGRGEIPLAMLPKDAQKAVEVISSKNANITVIRNEIVAALQDLENPEISREDKLRIGAGLVKTLNSTQGSDAVGAEEAKRLASELEGNIGKVAAAAAAGVGGGATIGGVAGSVIPGLGTAIGGALGAIGGGISAGALGLLDAMDDPGGVRFRADIEGFTSRVKLTAKKLDAAIEMNRKTGDYMKQGLPADEAAKKAAEDFTKKLQGKK